MHYRQVTLNVTMRWANDTRGWGRGGVGGGHGQTKQFPELIKVITCAQDVCTCICTCTLPLLSDNNVMSLTARAASSQHTLLWLLIDNKVLCTMTIQITSC